MRYMQLTGQPFPLANHSRPHTPGGDYEAKVILAAPEIRNELQFEEEQVQVQGDYTMHTSPV